ncbi:DUF748 domain-containing protein, partial [bacterium]
MNGKIKILIGSACFMVAVYLFLWLGLPPIARNVAVSKLSEALGRKTEIESVAFNPFTLTAQIKGVKIYEADGVNSFVSLGGIRVNLQISSLFRLAPVVSEVALDEPKIAIARNADQSYNFTDIIERQPKAGQKPATEEKKGDFKFLVENIRINGGEITFDDKPVSSSHKVAALNLFIPVISNLPVYVETFSKPELSFIFDGSAVKLDGETKPFADSLETRFDISLKDLDLTRFVPYSPTKLNVKINSARLDLGLALSYLQRKGEKPLLALTGQCALRDLAVVHADQAPLFSLKRLGVEIKSSDLVAKKVEIEKIAIEEPSLAIARDKKSVLSVSNLVAG